MPRYWRECSLADIIQRGSVVIRLSWVMLELVWREMTRPSSKVLGGPRGQLVRPNPAAYAHAARDPAIVMEDRVVTYGMLVIAIENCARRIVDANIDRSGVVAMLVQNPIRELTLCLALFRIGVRCMPLEPGQSGIASLNIAVALGDAQAKQRLNSAGRIIEVTDAWFTPEASAWAACPRPFPIAGRYVWKP